MLNGREMEGDRAFDEAVLASAFAEIAASGWSGFRLADAARAASLPLAEVRRRFPRREIVLLRLGQFADEAALADAEQAELAGGPLSSPRDRLFDMLMRRIDVFQQHRMGVLALLDSLPTDPPTALLLADATRASLRWLGEAAGLKLGGVGGLLRVGALSAVWLAALIAWRRDESVDLAGTMAALDRAIDRLARFDGELRAGVGGDASLAANAPPPLDPDLADVIVSPTAPPP